MREVRAVIPHEGGTVTVDAATRAIRLCDARGNVIASAVLPRAEFLRLGNDCIAAYMAMRHADGVNSRLVG